MLAANTLGQPGLWAFGISGDYPILLVRLNHEEEVGLLLEVMQAYTYWHRRGLMIDVVILNRLQSGYDQGLQGRIMRAVNRSGNADQLNKRGGIFVLHEDQLAEPQQVLLLTAARVLLDGEAGPLEEQLARLDADPIRLPRFVPIEQLVSAPITPTPRPMDLQFENSFGGFSPDGREYVIHLPPANGHPRPGSMSSVRRDLAVLFRKADWATVGPGIAAKIV